jgi:hypothetical protein
MQMKTRTNYSKLISGGVHNTHYIANYEIGMEEEIEEGKLNIAESSRKMGENI